MVLLLLAVVWAAVLVPPFMRARAEGRPADSIGSFRRQLNVLQRTGPMTVAPANTLRISSAPHLSTVPASLNPARRYSTADGRRARTLRRRRDVLLCLLGGMGFTLVAGLMPALRVLWGLHLVLDALFIGYVTLLVRMRNAAAEREMKVRFMPPRNQPVPAVIDLRDSVRNEPALALRRSAT